PDLASLPLALTCRGRERLNVPIARAVRFGNTAFAAIIRYAEKGMIRFALPRAQASTILRAARSIEIDATGIFRDQLNRPHAAPCSPLTFAGTAAPARITPALTVASQFLARASSAGTESERPRAGNLPAGWGALWATSPPPPIEEMLTIRPLPR